MLMSDEEIQEIVHSTVDPIVDTRANISVP